MAGLFEALTGEGARRLDLGARGKLRVRGSDRIRFANGMLTNDVAALPLLRSCAALLLDRKGRVLSDLVVLALEDALLLDVASGRSGIVAESLEQHVIADDVAIEDLGPHWSHVSFEGPAARTRLARSGRLLPEPQQLVFELHASERVIWLGGGVLTPEGVQLMGPRADVVALTQEASLPELDPQHAEVLRIEAAIPRYGVDVTEHSLPAEARLEHAISFRKGCYIGQEIVARVSSRGAVKRLLCQIRSEKSLQAGDPIRLGSAEVGEITSAASSSASGPVALGYVRAADATAGTKLDVGGVAAWIVGPDPGPSA